METAGSDSTTGLNLVIVTGNCGVFQGYTPTQEKPHLIQRVEVSGQGRGFRGFHRFFINSTGSKTHTKIQRNGIKNRAGN